MVYSFQGEFAYANNGGFFKDLQAPRKAVIIGN